MHDCMNSGGTILRSAQRYKLSLIFDRSGPPPLIVVFSAAYRSSSPGDDSFHHHHHHHHHQSLSPGVWCHDALPPVAPVASSHASSASILLPHGTISTMLLRTAFSRVDVRHRQHHSYCTVSTHRHHHRRHRARAVHENRRTQCATYTSLSSHR